MLFILLRARRKACVIVVLLSLSYSNFNPLTFYASEESANINIEDKRHRPGNIASEEAGGMISNHFLHSPKSEQCSATSYKVHNSNL